MTHFYVYFFKDGKYLFDRTMGTIESARDRVAYLEKFYPHATFTIDHVIKDAFY